MPDDFPVGRLAFPTTVRLVTTARLRDAVLRPLADTEEDLAALAEIEGATSARLVGQHRGTAGVPAFEFVFGVPHAAFINASFAYAKPRQPNRFNAPDRGAWYAALELETSLAEVTFHITEFLEQAGDFNTIVEYVEVFASLAGAYVDLRNADPAPECLHPDKSIGYPAGNALADQIRAHGHNGIVYPSVRHAGGTCVVALWPHAVQSVAQGDIYRLTWTGSPAPTVNHVTRPPT